MSTLEAGSTSTPEDGDTSSPLDGSAQLADASATDAAPDGVALSGKPVGDGGVFPYFYGQSAVSGGIGFTSTFVTTSDHDWVIWDRATRTRLTSGPGIAVPGPMQFAVLMSASAAGAGEADAGAAADGGDAGTPDEFDVRDGTSGALVASRQAAGRESLVTGGLSSDGSYAYSLWSSGSSTTLRVLQANVWSAYDLTGLPCTHIDAADASGLGCQQTPDNGNHYFIEYFSFADGQVHQGAGLVPGQGSLTPFVDGAGYCAVQPAQAPNSSEVVVYSPTAQVLAELPQEGLCGGGIGPYVIAGQGNGTDTPPTPPPAQLFDVVAPSQVLGSLPYYADWNVLMGRGNVMVLVPGPLVNATATYALLTAPPFVDAGVQAAPVSTFALPETSDALLAVTPDGHWIAADANALLFDDTSKPGSYASQGAILEQSFSDVSSGALATADDVGEVQVGVESVKLAGQTMVWDFSVVPIRLVFDLPQSCTKIWLSSDGAYLAGVAPAWSLSGPPGPASVWSIATGELVGQFVPHTQAIAYLSTAPCFSMARSAPRVATCAAGGLVHVTDLTGTTAIFDAQCPASADASESDASDVALSPNGDLLAIVEGADPAEGNYTYGPAVSTTTLFQGSTQVAQLNGAIDHWVDEQTLVVNYAGSYGCGEYSSETCWGVFSELYRADGTDLGPAPTPAPTPSFTTQNGGFLSIDVPSP